MPPFLGYDLVTVFVVNFRVNLFFQSCVDSKKVAFHVVTIP